MNLPLIQVPSDAIAGAYNGKMPARALFVHQQAYHALMRIAPYVVLSDLFRSPESSLAAMAKKTGVQPPSYSHHNYGAAVDLDVKASLKRGKFRDKRQLDEYMYATGWPPFNARLGATGAESWHYSYLPTFGGAARNTAAAAEAWIVSQFGADFKLSAMGIQQALANLRLYRGAIDGRIGPLSRTAIAMFQRSLRIGSWAKKKGLRVFVEGTCDAVTMRCLAYCAATRTVQP